MKSPKELRTECTLDAESIDTISDQVGDFLESLGIDEKNIIRTRISVEEMLLTWKDAFGDRRPLLFKCGKRFTRPYIRLEIEGRECDPVADAEYDWSRLILAYDGLTPVFTYSKNTNVVTINFPKRERGMPVKFVVAAALAVIAGLAGNMLPEAFRTVVAESVLIPAGDIFFGLIGMLAGPLIFLSIYTGICGIEDAASFGKTGRKIVLEMLGLTLLGAVLAAAVTLPLFGVSVSSGTSSSSAFTDIINMALGILPSNIVDPFLTGNSLQIIVLSCGFGVASLMIGSKMRGIIDICANLKEMIGVVMGWLTKLMPLLFFVILLVNIWADTISVVIQTWKPIAVILVAANLLFLAHTFWVTRRVKVKFSIYIRKIMPAFLIGLTTASSSAAFEEMLTTCEKRLGADKSITGFAVPIGIVAMRTVIAFEFITFLSYNADVYHLSVSPVWIITAVFTSFFLSVAMPPVPGGALSCYSLLFLSMGFPNEAAAIMVTANVIMDFFVTAVKIGMIQNEAIRQAYNCGKCDETILRDPGQG